MKMANVTALKINISVHELELGPSYRNGARGPPLTTMQGEGELASGKKWASPGAVPEEGGDGDGTGLQFPAFGG